MKEEREKKIISVLEGYSPKPGERFYRQMADSPWQRERKTLRRMPYRRIAASAVVLLVLGLALGFSTPPVRASFIRFLGLGISPSETVPNPAVPLQSLVDSREVNEIASAAGWEIKVPAWLPEGYRYSSALYDSSNQIALLTFLATYQLPGDDPKMTETKAITLIQALHNDILPLSVAPGAEVEDITINEQTAAYAIGAWENDFTSGKATWNATYPLQNVYWQIGDVFLTLNTADPQVSKGDLLRMAENMK